jgi:N,N'-diacetyllegionaminate synthase
MPKPVYIIAEIASAHEGKIKLLRKLYHIATDTGADAVKLQIFQRESLMSKFHHKFNSFGEIEISRNNWIDFLKNTSKSNTDLLVEVFDRSSLDIAEQSDAVDGYKIPTSSIGDADFIKLIAQTNKPIFLGIGGATIQEIEFALECIQALNNQDCVLMHGIQSFPTRLEDSQISMIGYLKTKFQHTIGYADHISADDYQFRTVLPAMAVSAGASVIEKHITDDRSRKGRDYFSSLEPSEFKEFVDIMNQMSPILGNNQDILSDAQNEYRYLMKQQAVASREIYKGEILKKGDLLFKRTGIKGISHNESRYLYGKKIKKNKAFDEPITLDDLYEE